MKKKIECQICDGKALLHFEKRIRTFRKQEYTVYEAFYKCDSCKEDFTTIESDEVTINHIYNQYREKYKIPSPEQLTILKKKYGLNSKSFSAVLGFGVNQYSNYEKGELPNESNGNLLGLCIDPIEVMKLLDRRKELFPEKKYKSISQNLKELIHDNSKNWYDLKNMFFLPNEFPNKFNGYSIPSFQKFSNMVLYFIDNSPYKTRLNKLLFYSDFAYFKYFGRSISGVKYAAIPNGPVPDEYELKFSLMAQENFLSTELNVINHEEVDKFVFLKEIDHSVFSKNEKSVMNEISNHFRYKKTQRIIDISHEEEGWKDNITNKSLISYLDYAPILKEI